MSHPRADLLPHMPHPGEVKVVKCPTNARGGECARLELTEPLNVLKLYEELLKYLFLRSFQLTGCGLCLSHEDSEYGTFRLKMMTPRRPNASLVQVICACFVESVFEKIRFRCPR